MRKRLSKQLAVFIGGALYFCALLVFMSFAKDEFSPMARFLAWILFLVGSLPAVVRLLGRSQQGIPVIETVMLAYVNAFALPVFYEGSLSLLIGTMFADTLPIGVCLTMAITAVGALFFGFRMAPRALQYIPFPRMALYCSPARLFYYGVVVACFALVNYRQFGQFNGVVGMLASRDLALALLALLYYKISLGPLQKIVIGAIVLAFIVKGISTGTTQGILQPLVIVAICRWLALRRLSLGVLAVVVSGVVLLQPVKLEYRQTLANSGESLGSIARVSVFADLFIDHWTSDDSFVSKIDSSSKNRTSLLLQTAHVIDWTPEVVPYKNGHTLSFLVVGWVPRFLWVDKPTAQVGNIEYALDYGVTTAAGIQTTMFGVGLLGDAYMNFGAWGVFPVFLILGFISYLPVHVLRARHILDPGIPRAEAVLHIAQLALLVAAVMRLIFIGSSIADVYGGIAQLIFVQGILMYIVIGDKSRRLFSFK